MQELKVIDLGDIRESLENNEPVYYEYYAKSEADKVIDELRDKVQMHDFFWEGCGFAKRGFKNTIAVAEHVENVERENAELKERLEELTGELRIARPTFKSKEEQSANTFEITEHKCEMCKSYGPGGKVKMVLEGNVQTIARFHLCTGCVKEMLETYKDVIKEG